MLNDSTRLVTSVSLPTKESFHDHLNDLYRLHRLSGLEHGTGRGLSVNTLGLHVSDHYQDIWVAHDLDDATFAMTTTMMGRTPGAKRAPVAVEVSNLDAFVQKMKQRGVSFMTEAFNTSVCRMAVTQDPDNSHITIHKRHR